MKKLIISLLTVILFSTTASAVTYRGFVDAGVGIITGDDCSSIISPYCSTTHGIQINPHLFVGVGMNVIDLLEMSFDNGDDVYFDYMLSLSPYLALRYDVNVIKRWSPFIECGIGKRIYTKYGSEFNDNERHMDDLGLSSLFINPKIGIRLKVSTRCAFNFAISYVPYKFNMTYTKRDWNMSHDSWNIITVNKAKKTNYITFNLGFDF